MKKLLCISLILLLCNGVKSQNLILNGDFGSLYSCPIALSMIDSAQFWINATTNGTPDYFHQCGNPFFAGIPVNGLGYQPPHSGEGYAGVYLWQSNNNYREFMAGQLTAPLAAGTCYHFEMFINAANHMRHTASNIGVLFSDTLITGILGFQMQTFTPQIVNPAGAYPDTVSWMPVTGNFTAAGGESFVTIGNFVNDAGLDTLIVHPFGIWPGTYVYVDDVSLTACTGLNDPVSVYNVHIFPSPVNDILNIESNYHAPAEITIYNSTLQLVFRSLFSGKTTIDLSDLGSGIYFYKIQSKGGEIATGKVAKQ